MFEGKKLGFGLMRLPLTDPEDKASIDMEQLKDMVDTFLEQGYTYFDTAWMYCGFGSERAIKEALVQRHPRDRYTLTTKLHVAYVESEADRDRIFNEQLEKTGAGYFDYYLIHSITADNYEKYKQFDCFNWVQEKKRLGLVKRVGFSFHATADVLERVLTEHPEMEFVQLQLNYLDWESDAIQSRRCYEVARKHGKPIIVMEPVKGGTLAQLPADAEAALKALHPDRSAAAWALRYVAGLEGVSMVLSGMSNRAQLLDNMATFDDLAPLNDTELAALRRTVAVLNKSSAIPCTACAYCVDGCPMNIPIPQYFSLYNADLQEVKGKDWLPQEAYYDGLTEEYGKASACIGCGQCEQVCPQHLPVIDGLKRVAAHFE